jgi:hypothetical protein
MLFTQEVSRAATMFAYGSYVSTGSKAVTVKGPLVCPCLRRHCVDESIVWDTSVRPFESEASRNTGYFRKLESLLVDFVESLFLHV